MKRKVIEKTALKQKSSELGIPFSNLLAGHILEELMYLISDSPFVECLWLKNSEIFGIEQYQKKNILTLEFAYITDEKVIKKGTVAPGQKLSLKMGYVILAHILKKEKIPEIKWRGRAAFLGEAVELEITGEFEEMTVPFRIRIQESKDQELIPLRRELIPVMREKQKIFYLEYPMEQTLTEQLFTLLNQMELITDMGVYMRIYDILKEKAVDGRHIREMLGERCKKEGIPLEEDRVDIILSYTDYTYMRKRFEKYLRHRKKEEPTWDTVMERISAFLQRVWRSICKDTVFFGDWMPDLGRFLE